MHVSEQLIWLHITLISHFTCIIFSYFTLSLSTRLLVVYKVYQFRGFTGMKWELNFAQLVACTDGMRNAYKFFIPKTSIEVTT
jgi:hypothetical protein